MGHLHNGILFSHKKENFTLCNSMHGPGEHYAKWNKPVRERQIPYPLTLMWNLMNKLNQQAKQLQTHRWRADDSRAVLGGGEGVEELRRKEKDSWTWTTVW